MMTGVVYVCTQQAGGQRAQTAMNRLRGNVRKSSYLGIITDEAPGYTSRTSLVRGKDIGNTIAGGGYQPLVTEVKDAGAEPALQ